MSPLPTDPWPRHLSCALDGMPHLAVAGPSGSGKTTLLEAVVPDLMKQGLRLAVIKHTHHPLAIDQPGKDSMRFFTAGADVLLTGGDHFYRCHTIDVSHALRPLLAGYDLVLLEGYKHTPMAKIWLTGPGETAPPAEAGEVLACYTRDQDRVSLLRAFIARWLPAEWQRCPLVGCILIGGQSRRMGRPKHLLTMGARTLLEQTVDRLRDHCDQVIVVGRGALPDSLAHLPQLADVPHCHGPLSGLLAAMRWRPRCRWLVTACDLPHCNEPAIEWLLAQERPGYWAILPRLGTTATEPLFALYDWRSQPLLENLAATGNHSLQQLNSHLKIASPRIPDHLHQAWENCNTPADLLRIRQQP